MSISVALSAGVKFKFISQSNGHLAFVERRRVGRTGRL